MEIINLKNNMQYIKQTALLERELWGNNVSCSAYIDTIKKALKKPNYTIFLAKDENTILGYVETDIFYSYDEKYSLKPILFICGLYVTPSKRNNGVATNLLQELEKYARDIGCEQIASSYYSFNKESKKLHDKLGFKETSQTINVIKNI